MPSMPSPPAVRNGIAAARSVFAGIAAGALKSPQADTAAGAVRCRLCTCLLGTEADDDPGVALCGSCRRRPEARRLGLHAPAAARARPEASRPARDFTDAERALIRKIHGFMPAQQLLALLNERLACDLGPDATPYSMEQLHAAIGGCAVAAPTGGLDWAAQRKLIAQARRAGLLAAITEQLIDDFAVVFSLNPKQVLVLRDTLLQPQEGA